MVRRRPLTPKQISELSSHVDDLHDELNVFAEAMRSYPLKLDAEPRIELLRRLICLAREASDAAILVAPHDFELAK